jgi:hypothetical protein
MPNNKLFSFFQSVPVKKLSLSQCLKRKLNIMCQWQSIAAVLPLLAVLFFLILGTIYLRATYSDQQDSKVDRAVQPTFLDPMLEQVATDRYIALWCSIKSFLWNLVVFVVFAFLGKYPQKNFIIFAHTFLIFH